jgi:hypothetical protein
MLSSGSSMHLFILRQLGSGGDSECMHLGQYNNYEIVAVETSTLLRVYSSELMRFDGSNLTRRFMAPSYRC